MAVVYDETCDKQFITHAVSGWIVQVSETEPEGQRARGREIEKDLGLTGPANYQLWATAHMTNTTSFNVFLSLSFFYTI
ncbi:unnamed protein product [Prunus armeniaca]|uniref:Uncharacterized protein n=1 Tax=Prunus armeniaca TaxID=36596 RepID=A0A6J5TKG4_PRUAR|nr:unnamed protein product [Prunus armeniaca]